MARLQLSASAIADLREILEYSVERHGAEQGDIYVLSFQSAFDRLREMPALGAFDVRIDPPIRSIAHRRHRIYYDIEEGVIIIRRILHSARDAGPQLI